MDLGDGIKFALEKKIQAGPQSMHIRIGSVEINSDIDKGLFNLD